MRCARTLTGPSREEALMPVWLEVLLNLSGYAGFVALATRGAAPDDVSADERICGGGR